MADYRSLEIKVSHARNLKNVNFLSNMDTYVVVSLSSDPQNNLKTPINRTGSKNPTWTNFSLKFAVDVAVIHLARPTLTFSILCERALGGDKPIGEVHVPLVSLLDGIDSGKACHVAYQVKRPSGRGKGELSFSYQWGKRLSVAGAPATAPPLPEVGKMEEVVTAYPLVTEGSSSDAGYVSYGPYQHQPVPQGGYQYQYPPPVVGYSSHTPYGGYTPPHQYGGYPPPSPSTGYGYQAQMGYGYPPVQHAPKKSSKIGLGLGAGLLGGLLVGDILF